MAETTALRKARLDAERQALKGRIVTFKHRIADDREAVVDEARRVTGPDSVLARHPTAVVATSAAVGFVAATVPPPGLPDVDQMVAPAGKLAAKGIGAGATSLKVEAAAVLRDFVDGLFAKKEPKERSPETA